MRLGVVDLGTLSLRFDVYELSPQSKPVVVFRHRSMPRLGDDLYRLGCISEEKTAWLIDELKKVKQLASEHGADKLLVVATSALREMPQSEKLLSQISTEVGINLRIISGQEEARLTALGIAANEKLPNGRTVLFDIGGGSTEITLCAKQEPLVSISLPLGVSRLAQLYPHPEADGSKVTDQNKSKALRENVKQILNKHLDRSVWTKVISGYGSSGTARAVERLVLLEDESSTPVSREQIADLLKRMLELNKDELAKLPNMEEARLHIVIPGAIVLEEIMDFFELTALNISRFSLRHGVLEEERRSLR